MNNEKKFFDKPQLLITIIGVFAFVISIILFIIMFLTGTVTYKDNGTIDEIIYQPTLFSIYSVFILIHFLMLLWFILRAITFKLRIREEDDL